MAYVIINMLILTDAMVVDNPPNKIPIFIKSPTCINMLAVTPKVKNIEIPAKNILHGSGDHEVNFAHFGREKYKTVPHMSKSITNIPNQKFLYSHVLISIIITIMPTRHPINKTSY